MDHVHKMLYEDLYKKYRQPITRHALRSAPYDYVCEAVQDAWLSVMERPQLLKTVDDMHSYLSRAVYHRAIDLHRRAVISAAQYPRLLHDAAPSPEDALILAESEEYTKALLWACVNDLPAKQRDALLLYYVDQLSTEEIMKKLNIAEKALRMRLSRARKGLRQRMCDPDAYHIAQK